MGTIMYWLAGIWPIVGHISFWVVSMAACGAVVWVRPALWKQAAWVAAIITAGTVCYAIGVYDGERRVRAQWDAATKAILSEGLRARAGAERDIARKPSRWMPNDKPDRYRRD